MKIKMKNIKDQVAGVIGASSGKFSTAVVLNPVKASLLALGGIGLAAWVWRSLQTPPVGSMPKSSANHYGEDHRLNLMISDVSTDETSAYVENPSPS